MSKEEAVQLLGENSYRADIRDGIPVVFIKYDTQEQLDTDTMRVRHLLISHGYRGSYGWIYSKKGEFVNHDAGETE